MRQRYALSIFRTNVYFIAKRSFIAYVIYEKKNLKRDDSPIEREANDFQKVELQ